MNNTMANGSCTAIVSGSLKPQPIRTIHLSILPDEKAGCFCYWKGKIIPIVYIDNILIKYFQYDIIISNNT